MTQNTSGKCWSDSFLHNYGTAFLGMLAMVLNTVLNLAIAWQMQQLIDIAAGNGAFLTMA